MNAIASSILVLAGSLLFALSGGDETGVALGVAIIILGVAGFGQELGWWRPVGQVVRDLAAEFNSLIAPGRRPPSRPEPPMPGDAPRQNDH